LVGSLRFLKLVVVERHRDLVLLATRNNK
jgi:hypothetical protein